MGRSLVQRSPTECGVSECDFGTLSMGKPSFTRLGMSKDEKKNIYIYIYNLAETRCEL
jgi:hypothetical protein